MLKSSWNTSVVVAPGSLELSLNSKSSIPLQAHNATQSHVGGCLNCAPFFEVPIIARHLIFRVPKKGP